MNTLRNTFGTDAEGIRIVQPVAPEEVEALVRLFEDVARQEGWQTGQDLHAYRDRSVYFALTDGQTILGGLQLVPGNKEGRLPCRRVWPELDLAGREDIADVALLALRPECRGGGELFWLLCVEMWRYCVASGVQEIWTEVTPRNLRLYRRLGWPLRIAGPLRLHWGEDCYPAMMGVRHVAAVLEARARSAEAYRQRLAQAYRPGRGGDGSWDPARL